MPLSNVDYGFLQAHEFLRFYPNYRDRLLPIAKRIYQALSGPSSMNPSALECEIHMEVALLGSTVFADIVAELCATIKLPGPTDSFWRDYFAGPVARYVVEQEWHEISA
jgi:hypothetical protein